MTHYVAFETNNPAAIDGLATSKTAAWAEVAEATFPRYDSNGDDRSMASVRRDYTIAECTAALAKQVEAEGGAIAWGELPDGRACTCDEEDAA